MVEKLIICSVLPGDRARVQAWSLGSLGDNLRRQRRKDPVFLPVCAFEADVDLTRLLLVAARFPLVTSVQWAADSLGRAPLEAPAQRAIFRHISLLGERMIPLWNSWRLAVG